MITLTCIPYFKRCKSVSIHGIQYKAGDVVRLQCDSPDNARSYSYAAIIEVLVVQEEKIFVTEVKGFKKLLCAFKVAFTDTIGLVPYISLYCHGVLPLVNKSGFYYIIEKNYCFKDLWSLF